MLKRESSHIAHIVWSLCSTILEFWNDPGKLRVDKDVTGVRHVEGAAHAMVRWRRLEDGRAGVDDPLPDALLEHGAISVKCSCGQYYKNKTSYKAMEVSLNSCYRHLHSSVRHHKLRRRNFILLTNGYDFRELGWRYTGETNRRVPLSWLLTLLTQKVTKIPDNFTRFDSCLLSFTPFFSKTSVF